MANKRQRKKQAKKVARGLTTAQVRLRSQIAVANKRLKRLSAAGIDSPAAERLLTALGLNPGENVKIGKKTTKTAEMIISRAVDAFLDAATSTVKGFKRVEEKRLAKTVEFLKDIGVDTSDKNIRRAQTGLQTYKHYQEIYGITSGDVARWVGVVAEQGGDAAAVERAMRLAYDNADNPDIDVDDISDDY